MPEIHIPLNYEGKDLIPFDEIPIGSVYITNSSPLSRCLKVDSEMAILLRNDSGHKRIGTIVRPSKAREVLGQLVGVTVETK